MESKKEKKPQYYRVKKYVVEEFEVLAISAKEAVKADIQDPSVVTVTKITAVKSKTYNP